MVALEQPGQDLCEGNDADDRAGADDGQTDDIPLVHGGQHELVFAQQYEDKRTGNAGQDHGTDGQHAA